MLCSLVVRVNVGVLLVVYNFTVVVEGLGVLCAACRVFVFGNILGCLSDIYGVACRLHAFWGYGRRC